MLMTLEPAFIFKYGSKVMLTGISIFLIRRKNKKISYSSAPFVNVDEPGVCRRTDLRTYRSGVRSSRGRKLSTLMQSTEPAAVNVGPITCKELKIRCLAGLLYIEIQSLQTSFRTQSIITGNKRQTTELCRNYLY